MALWGDSVPKARLAAREPAGRQYPGVRRGVRRRWASVVAALATVAVFAGGCGGNPAGQGQDTAGAGGDGANDVAVYASSSEVMVFWDPADSFSNEIIAMNNMYETLVRAQPDGTVKPLLATSWESSPDGLTWTFHLRQGVKFHGSGAEMTAEHVKKAIERTIRRGRGASFIWAPVDRIEAKDKYTVVFHLKYPAPLDLIAAAGYGAFIYDADYAESQGGEEWFNAGHDAGTGPYTVQSWTKGGDLVLTRFDDYWQGWDGKHFRHIVFRTIEDPGTRRQAVEAGEADFVNQLPFDSLEALANHPQVEVVTAPSYQNLLALLNTEKLKDRQVREALAWAFPYEAAVQDVAAGYATQARGVVPAGLWGHSADLPTRSQDLDKARQLLEQAGGIDHKLLITYTSGDDAQRQIAELYAANLRSLGVEVEVRGMPWEAQWDLAKSPQPEQRQDILLFYWWPEYPTPDTFFRNMFHSEDEIVFNLSYYRNPRFDQLIDEAAKVAATDRDRAVALYRQADQILFDDVPVIPIYDLQYARVKKRSLKGYVDNPAYPNVVFWYDVYRE
ncbi:extracellular solute-binding protein family 5 [Thermaerobacter marianensis DSM 12885]|uniref:Extracellular solute-binding protein family 5 n=1 Tax=Thermaerobacter marianensis (strain ATCC 700841 / DSM 12885 / JCM 10246 / 7p75a) TaxID=644966 RepID=E6SIT6_THEM7|nr:extracellular solute-binding protein family 5 [Thermaerobacter marianensis DSM 12885]